MGGEVGSLSQASNAVRWKSLWGDVIGRLDRRRSQKLRVEMGDG